MSETTERAAPSEEDIMRARARDVLAHLSPAARKRLRDWPEKARMVYGTMGAEHSLRQNGCVELGGGGMLMLTDLGASVRREVVARG